MSYSGIVKLFGILVIACGLGQSAGAQSTTNFLPARPFQPHALLWSCDRSLPATSDLELLSRPKEIRLDRT